MVNQDILYIKKGNRETIIHYKNNVKEFKNKLITDVFNEICLKQLSTYVGRIQAIKEVYHLKKHIPVYLTNNLILIPIKNKREYDNIYINCCNIIDIVEDNLNSIILFNDSSELYVNQKAHLLKKYCELGLFIKYSQKNSF